jgi:50S ribosomal subunit-associated GTPase HflX
MADNEGERAVTQQEFQQAIRSMLETMQQLTTRVEGALHGSRTQGGGEDGSTEGDAPRERGRTRVVEVARSSRRLERISETRSRSRERQGVPPLSAVGVQHFILCSS